MAVLNPPTQGYTEVEFIRSFRLAGSRTIVWAQEMKTKRQYYLLRWGDRVYLPVQQGDHVGIGLYNGSPDYMAYPTYVEALNLWSGGPAQPEDCTPDHMWELRGYEQMVIDALMNASAQRGRPLVIVPSGQGYGIGEATFGTTEYRGQLRIYERRRAGSLHNRINPPVYRRDSDDVLRGAMPPMRGEDPFQVNESFGLGHTRGVGRGVQSKGAAAIGAGHEEDRRYQQTGVHYDRAVQPVISLFMETRDDLQRMLDTAWGPGWNWFWDVPKSVVGGGNWWDQPWKWQPPNAAPTAPQVPLAPEDDTPSYYRPHRPTSRRFEGD